MAKVLKVNEYKDDGFAIIEDSVGKYIATKNSPDIVPLYDNDNVQAWFGNRTPCALVQSREAMFT